MTTEKKELVDFNTGAKVLAMVPETFDQAWRLAQVAARSGIAPNDINTPEKAMAIILMGLEIGMKPMAALQRIAIINGRTVIYGDAAMALVRSSGLLESIKEFIEGEGDNMKAVCVVKRKGYDEQRFEFSVADAKQAGLWDERETVEGKRRDGTKYTKRNDSPWFRFPKRMLTMRARGFAFRDTFADVLNGMHLREEIEFDQPHEIDITPDQQAEEAPNPDGDEKPEAAQKQADAEAIEDAVAEDAPAPDESEGADEQAPEETSSEVSEGDAPHEPDMPEDIFQWIEDICVTLDAIDNLEEYEGYWTDYVAPVLEKTKDSSIVSQMEEIDHRIRSDFARGEEGEPETAEDPAEEEAPTPEDTPEPDGEPAPKERRTQVTAKDLEMLKTYMNTIKLAQSKQSLEMSRDTARFKWLDEAPESVWKQAEDNYNARLKEFGKGK